ncbi:hypothetical protein [Lentzea sp. NPDC055074]
MRDHLPEPRREQAAPVPRPTRAGLMALQSAAGNRAMSRLLSVQRNVGIELEDSQWSVVSTSKEAPGRVRKSVPIAVRDEFQLQAEDGPDRSALEIVSHPPGVVDDHGLNTLIAEVEDTIHELDKRVGRRAFSSDKLTGGRSGFQLYGYRKFKPFMQMTVGVPLSRLAALQAALGSTGLAEVAVPGERWSIEAAQQVVGASPSPELVGLIQLVRSYLVAGDVRRQVHLLKELVPVMARTDLATMFTMLPATEQETIRLRQYAWVAALVEGLTIGGTETGAAPVFSQDVKYQDKGLEFVYGNTTTRREWLRAMSRPQGADLLSAGGKAGGLQDGQRAAALRIGIEWRQGSVPAEQLLEVLEELHEGFGALGNRTDQVVYSDQPRDMTPAAILELRSPKQEPDWQTAARMIQACVQQVIGLDGARPFLNLMTEDGVERKRQAREVGGEHRQGRHTADKLLRFLTLGAFGKGS